VGAAQVVRGRQRPDLEQLVPGRVEVVDAEAGAQVVNVRAAPQLGVRVAVGALVVQRRVKRKIDEARRNALLLRRRQRQPLGRVLAERIVGAAAGAVGRARVAVDGDGQAVREEQLVEADVEIGRAFDQDGGGRDLSPAGLRRAPALEWPMAEEPFIPDGARETLAPLLGLRPLVGSRAPHAAAERFDTGLSLLGTMLDTLRCRSEVDSEAAMEHMLPVIAGRMDATVKALRDAGEAGAAGTLARTLEAVIAPVKEHLARWRAAPRVHAGPCAVLRIAPDEYLILCMMCLAPAERLRAPRGPEGCLHC